MSQDAIRRDGPDRAPNRLLLAHGAGQDMDSDFIHDESRLNR